MSSTEQRQATVHIFNRETNGRIEIPVKPEDIEDVINQIDEYNKNSSLKQHEARVWVVGN